MRFGTVVLALLTGAALAASPLAGRSEVLYAKDTAFGVRHAAPVDAAPGAVFEAITQDISAWWNPDHSWSGEAENLYFETGAGGCFCERLPNGGGVEHLRVIYYAPGREIRMTGALGPLQQMGLNGAMSWRIESGGDDGRSLVFEYRVNGHSEAGMIDLAPVVDGVIGEQHARLLSLLAGET